MVLRSKQIWVGASFHMSCLYYCDFSVCFFFKSCLKVLPYARSLQRLECAVAVKYTSTLLVRGKRYWCGSGMYEVN